ncbi:hypothetical protein [Maricaulis sp.]|uniref:hypothetical protein n=1 Tax=Maricaulis sp. TaxID=1486257 RepID=UPI002627F333|nr:hypothetical protein [Maricaulis sp.]
MSQDQTGRYVETDKVALGVWKRLTETFSTTKLLVAVLIMRHGSWPFRKDDLGNILSSQRWKLGLGLLGGLDDDQVDFLERYAAINVRRVEQVFRANALFLVTIPIGALVAVNEVAPEFYGFLGVDFVYTLIAIIAAWAAAVGVLFAALWRSRDLHDLVSFEQARRLHANAKMAAAENQTAEADRA